MIFDAISSNIMRFTESTHLLVKLSLTVSIDFLSNSEWDVPFHHIAYDYACDGWDSLRDHLRDVSWEDIFKLSASAAASGF